MTRVAIATLVLSLGPGCALAHEIGHDAAIDAAAATRVLSPCPTGSPGGLGRDCGWSAGGGIACRPGATVRIGCASGCGVGTCTGDSMIRVCDTAPCLAMQALASSDDACGSLCSFVDGVTCPDSGQLFVLTGPFSPGTPYTCSFDRR